MIAGDADGPQRRRCDLPAGAEIMGRPDEPGDDEQEKDAEEPMSRTP